MRRIKGGYDLIKQCSLIKQRDVNRTESPLRKADDAIEIDNSNLTPAEQQQILRTLFAEKTLEH